MSAGSTVRIVFQYFPYKSESCHFQKHSDDSAVVECIGDGLEYREPVDGFVAWCVNKHLILNGNETKGMTVDFRKTKNNLDIRGGRAGRV